MIEANTTWYLGTVGPEESYRLAKYSSTTGKDLTANTATVPVGLLRLGELLSGHFATLNSNVAYWTINPRDSSIVYVVSNDGTTYYTPPSYNYGIKPALNLKANIVIMGGEGTKNNPFILQ